MQEIKAYPNPTSAQFTITGAENAKRVKIAGLNGQTVMEKEINQADLAINITLPELQKGVYLLIIESKRGRIVKRLIIN